MMYGIAMAALAVVALFAAWARERKTTQEELEKANADRLERAWKATRH